MQNIKATFDKIKNALNQVLGDSHPLLKTKKRPGPKYRLTDLEIIILSLTADYIGLKSENYLFEALNSDYKNYFPDLLSRRQYNDRKRNLKKQIVQLQELISTKMEPARRSMEIYVVDSMPLRLCRLSRHFSSTICKDNENLKPKVSWCAAQDERYYGFKLHLICSEMGVIKAYRVENPSVDERQYLEEVAKEFKGCRIVGDKGYISQERRKTLLEEHRIVLETPFKKNMKNQKPFIWGKVRKTIEKVFSQLNEQFRMQLNYAKSINGYLTRINSKLCTMTLMNLVNKTNGKNIGEIQYALK